MKVEVTSLSEEIWTVIIVNGLNEDAKKNDKDKLYKELQIAIDQENVNRKGNEK